ncbi:hypothetical protein SMC26_32310 [Actinomadura fulvescens]|uniref:Secreted protein n=1 Tax=Actinomadura fulvescens TaxID=46160 RepID=A0ABN3PXB2_9ACTN
MRLQKIGALAALPLALTLTLGACGSEDEKPKVASASSGDPQAGASGGPKLSSQEMGVKFAECMRKNGIPMEDPKPGQGMRFMSKGQDQAKMQKAQEACREFNPMTNGAARPDPQAEERGRQYAACMRKNGVEKFPDPKPGQRGIMINPEAGEDPDMPTAQKACESILQRGGPNGGAPGGGGGQ